MSSRRNQRSSQPRCVEQSVEGLDEVEIIITTGDLSHSSTSSLPSHAAPVQSSSLEDIGHLGSPGQAAHLAVTGENLGEETITKCNIINVELIHYSDVINIE